MVILIGYSFSSNNKTHINNSLNNTNYNKLNKFKGTWDQRNNFYLKLSLFIIKQYGINQKLQKFPLKPQLAYYVCSFAEMTSLL